MVVEKLAAPVRDMAEKGLQKRATAAVHNLAAPTKIQETSVWECLGIVLPPAALLWESLVPGVAEFDETPIQPTHRSKHLR